MKSDNTQSTIGIIGGSGIYDLDKLTDAQWIDVESSFGKPSDSILIGFINSQRVAFLPRHGRGHRYSPSEINYLANIDALKRCGVNRLFSFSAVGSLSEKIEPGTFVIVDQFIDQTFARKKSFFHDGFVAHVSMANPVCSDLGDIVEQTARKIKLHVKRGGTYLVMEGPQFSTLAESRFYRTLGSDIIGMTNMPEAKLAREAEIAYCSIAMVTDYDCWHDDHDNVTAQSVLVTLSKNISEAKRLIQTTITSVDKVFKPCSDGCNTSLDNALCTGLKFRSETSQRKLETVAKRVINKSGWID